MPRWNESMQETFLFYEVDPNTWGLKRELKNIISCTINRDSGTDTLESATFVTTEEIGECYIRPFLQIIQNGIKETLPLGTFLVQTNGKKFNGKRYEYTLDGYSSLTELKEDQPPLGYTVNIYSNVLDRAYRLTNEHCRAPVVKPLGEVCLNRDFVANVDDTFLSFNADLMRYADYKYGLDEIGRILFVPVSDFSSIVSKYTFSDDEASILLPDISDDRDLYSIPNRLEVIYSNNSGTRTVVVQNEEADSPVSIQNRGRVITYRDRQPSIHEDPTDRQLEEYAYQKLISLSNIEHTITFSHGFVPVYPGDCVRLNYKRSNIYNKKILITSQQINCKTGCTIQSTGVYSEKLFNGTRGA